MVGDSLGLIESGAVGSALGLTVGETGGDSLELIEG